jgi:glycine/D-amino acid oxidase-like deaminating enzyme
MKNHSPWLAQLRHTRPPVPLSQNVETDVCVIGAGIAGVSTAYFLLKYTQKKVVLIEAGKVAHGATGHNAGQITSYFETPFSELVRRYGVSLAREAQHAIDEDARLLIESILVEANLDIPNSQFIGYDGFVREDQIVYELNELRVMEEAGLRIRPLLVSKEWLAEHPLPVRYASFYTAVAHQEILSVLESRDPRYIAAKPYLSGCMNSALFTEELVGFLLATYKDRFSLYEYTPASEVIVRDAEVTIVAGIHAITAQHVVLCTNGFENIRLQSTHGTDIDTAFHHSVEGVIGYMAAYREKTGRPPYAGIYSSLSKEEQAVMSDSVDLAEPYIYVTRRPFDIEGDMEKKNLVSIGGPDRRLPSAGMYDATSEFPEDMRTMLHSFAHTTLYDEPHAFEFLWHGLMGYTKSGVRLIGHEPLAPRLLYNLGCNGVGLLTSVYGADRVARLLNGETFAPSIFDPAQKPHKTKMARLRTLFETLKKKGK